MYNYESDIFSFTVSNECEAEVKDIITVKHWTKDGVLNLIRLHEEHDHLFSKGGVKKKSVWERISRKLSDLGYTFSPLQCEQKWKNLTKQYRDVVDHNAKSGNDVKECPFFTELNEVYGYRLNVKPLCLLGSSPADSNNNEEISIEEKSESGSSTTINKRKHIMVTSLNEQKNPKTVTDQGKNKSQDKEQRKIKTTDNEVITFLK